MKLRLGALALLVAAALVQGPALQAGHPMKCDPAQGAPCNMKSCAHLAKKEAWCSLKCHKNCCMCPTEGPNWCNGHRQEAPIPEDEKLEAGLQSGRVD